MYQNTSRPSTVVDTIIFESNCWNQEQRLGAKIPSAHPQNGRRWWGKDDASIRTWSPIDDGEESARYHTDIKDEKWIHNKQSKWSPSCRHRGRERPMMNRDARDDKPWSFLNPTVSTWRWRIKLERWVWTDEIQKNDRPESAGWKKFLRSDTTERYEYFDDPSHERKNETKVWCQGVQKKKKTPPRRGLALKRKSSRIPVRTVEM